MRTENRIVYIANDDSEWDTEEDALARDKRIELYNELHEVLYLRYGEYDLDE